MAEYEMIKELFDNCSHSARTFFEEIESDDLDNYMKQYIREHDKVQHSINKDGAVVYEVISGNVLNRYTFTKI